MLALYFGQWEYWENEHKVTFDGRRRRIIVNDGVTDLDIQTDVYSDWKEWARNGDNLKFARAIRTIGGDPTVGNLKAGDIYFFMNGWQMELDPTVVRITGVLFSDDFESPLVNKGTNDLVFAAAVSNLVTGKDTPVNVVTGDLSEVPTAQENATAVMEEVVPANPIENSLGDYLANQLLSVKKFIGLS